MTFKFDLLVYLALGGLILVILVAGILMYRTPDNVDVETRKIRFAAATFTGIMMLFVFAACLYFAGDEPGARTGQCCAPDSAGKEIFDKGVSAMFTLAGSIVGYLFGISGKPNREPPTDIVPLSPTNNSDTKL